MSPRCLKHILLAAAILLSAFASPGVHAQAITQTIYNGSLQNGWQNWSWATVNLANSSPTYPGTSSSISVTPAGAYQALYLHHTAQSSSPYTSLTFWINGGPTGGQGLLVQATLGGIAQAAYPIGAPAANKWQQVTVPLSALGAAGQTTFDGIWIKSTSGSAEPTFYVDDVTLNPIGPVVLTINAGHVVRTINNSFYGLNTAEWDSYLGGADSVSLLKQMQTQLLRFPGGSASDGYNWTQPGQSWQPSYATFAQTAQATGAQSIITVNYGSGTPQMAAAWVAYANGSPSSTQVIGVDAHGTNWQTVGYWASLRAASPLSTDDGFNFLRINHPAPFGVLYWEVGNECYGSWENDQHGIDPALPGAAHDGYTYAQYYAQFYKQMKAVDPGIEIGAVSIPGQDASGDGQHAVPNPNEGNSLHSGWTPVVLATLQSLGVTPDFLIFHNYPEGPGNENDAALLQDSGQWAGDASNLRQMLTDYSGSAGAGVHLLATESNSVYGNPGKQSVSLVNGLYYADSFASIAQTEFDSCIWWDFRNGSSGSNNNSSSLYGWRMYGDYGIVAAGNAPGPPVDTPYPPFYAAELLTHWARGGDEVVAAASDNPLLSVYAAALSDGDLALLVINKDPVNDLTGDFSISGFAPGSSTATVYQYGKPQDLATAGLTQGTLTNAGTAFAEVFPSYSMSVIDLAAPTVLATSSISGVVSLQEVAAGNRAQPLVFTLTPTENTSGTVTNQTITPDATTGAFTLTNVPPGTYTLGVKGSKWLRRDTAVDTTHGNVSGLTISLLGGDINGDNQVSLSDFLILRNAYGSQPGSANWNPNADLQCDGEVSLADVLMIINNYSKQGDP